MKLHWSPRSPFVRKVMVLVHEAGLAQRLTLLRTVVAMSDPNIPLMDDNPLGKIPTLVLEDGTILYDSPVICEYLDNLHGGRRLFPQSGPEKWTALRRQALGDGLMDLLVLWRNERTKPPERQTKSWLDGFALKMNRSLAALEAEAPDLARGFDIGHIALGGALSYIDFRFPDLDWRKGHSKLAAWHAGFDARPSVLATRPNLEAE
ncbi:MAG: glutathione S-transferase [Betaproteobacteria bacterium RIFCSPLOWO2_02_FULL_62_17]|nr:MAG: glutathione S-transferase [Betaproteobacteria bacterium RIFCSPLOWO2_02_FULL_62_17]